MYVPHLRVCLLPFVGILFNSALKLSTQTFNLLPCGFTVRGFGSAMALSLAERARNGKNAVPVPA